MSSNVDILSKMLVPRKYQDTSLTLRHDLAVLLRDHPEAFDCLIFPARPSEENERVTVDPPVAGLLDRDERGISYGEPIQARAYIVPQEDLAFQVVDSALYESIVADPGRLRSRGTHLLRQGNAAYGKDIERRCSACVLPTASPGRSAYSG